jgi:multiple sugar transport system permease protein
MNKEGDTLISNLKKLNKAKEPYIYIFPALILVILFIGIPMIIGIKTSFYHYRLNDIKTYFVGFQNYIDVIKNPIFNIALKNSFWWVFLSLVFQVTLGVTLALCLNKSFRGRSVYQAFVLAPWAVSGFIIGLIWKWLLNGQYGLVNDILMKLHIVNQPLSFLSDEGMALNSTILANIWYGIPFFAIMTLAALQSIPEEVYEACDIDGANSIQKLFKITLPYIKPTLIVTILLRVIWIFNFADIIYVMTTGGPANSSQNLATFVILKAYTGLDFGQASALGVIFILILLVYVLFYLAMTNYEKAGDF